MISCLILFMYLFCPSLLIANSDILISSQRAQAFWDVHDDTEAEEIYNQILLQQALTPWQKARVLYNIGTIKLSQSQPNEAFNYFSKINMNELSIPRYGENLLINEGILYLQNAHFFSQSDPQFLYERALFIEHAINIFSAGLKLNCEVQKNESHSSNSCENDLIIRKWLTIAQQDLDEVNQKKKNELITTTTEKNTISSNQIAKLDNLYKTIHSQEILKPENLENLLSETQQLNNEQIQKISKITEFLKMSLEKSKREAPFNSRFFFLAAFNEFISFMLSKINDSEPKDILQFSLQQAHLAFQAFLLSIMIVNKENIDPSISSVLKEMQKNVLETGVLFIPSVIEEQNKLYHSSKEMERCQQYPWEKVIPLFDRGYHSALKANKLLNSEERNLIGIQIGQEECIRFWQQALNILLRPPPQNKSSDANSLKSLTETIRLIQEMYSQDEPSTEQQQKELHSW